VFVFLCCEVVASVPDSREFCLEDAAAIRELEVSSFQHGVVVVCSDDVARSASCISSGSIGVASNCVRVCVLNQIVEVVSLILSAFSWGHNSEVLVEVEHWCDKIPVETSGDVKLSDEDVVDICVCVDGTPGLREGFQRPVFKGCDSMC
jgi:hypothetical protein